ncbi:eukaryotic aspartyl protease family protein [Striga asiatica]|uniref:Eukaryotic aspartyl protease family protein n=1 Tax=Striga asiatica TaxID=4170 RepID=A0A5A7QP59_STRAF|nr:eukaryotic aspartyl protease family protein [Striga asiatica]
MPGHRCKQQLYTMEGDEEEPEEVETRHYVKEDLEISVNAMSGVHGPRTIKLPASVLGRSIEVLIDTGSSHNFISAILSDALKLPATKVEPFDVRVANRERLRCREYYRDVPINLQGETIKADLYSLPLVGPGIVLGVQWLEGLGEVKTKL